MILTHRLINLRDQKIPEKATWTITTTDETLFYKHRMKAEERKDDEDETMGWEQFDRCYERLIHRKYIAALDLDFIDTPEKYSETDGDKWRVSLSILGSNDDLRMYFRKEEDAREVFSKLQEWWLKTN